jgi:hypothetical protein
MQKTLSICSEGFQRLFIRALITEIPTAVPQTIQLAADF